MTCTITRLKDPLKKSFARNEQYSQRFEILGAIV